MKEPVGPKDLTPDEVDEIALCVVGNQTSMRYSKQYDQLQELKHLLLLESNNGWKVTLLLHGIMLIADIVALLSVAVLDTAE